MSDLNLQGCHIFQPEEKMRYIITKQNCSTNLVFILTSQKTGSVLLFLATLSTLKISHSLKIQTPCLNLGLFFFSSFLGRDFKWSMLCPLMATNYPWRWYKHGYMSLVRTFLVASDIFLKHHLSRFKWSVQKLFLFKTNFLLTFKQRRSNNLDLPMAVRNQDKSQSGSLVSILLHVYLWNLSQWPDLISNHSRSLGPAWVVRSLSNPEGKNLLKFKLKTKFTYYRKNLKACCVEGVIHIYKCVLVLKKQHIVKNFSVKG